VRRPGFFKDRRATGKKIYYSPSTTRYPKWVFPSRSGSTVLYEFLSFPLLLHVSPVKIENTDINFIMNAVASKMEIAFNDEPIKG
jgi:hypothetical protein